MCRVSPIALLTLASVGYANTLIETRGTSLTLNSIDYFVPPSVHGKIALDVFQNVSIGQSETFLPVTVVSRDVQRDSFSTLFDTWRESDDVWTPDFLGTVFTSGVDIDGGLPKSCGNVTVNNFIASAPDGLPSGPYFVNTMSGELHQAYRLYDDYQAAFLQPLLQQTDGSFHTLAAKGPGSSTMTIGVPSRLYFAKSTGKPLAGVRIGVKDLYDLKGVRSSRGNRAWYGLYESAETTAPAIQNLIDAGAVIVGVQKMSQFANGEEPTADWVDYQAPFNPRGDGYQDPSSSSSGAGASVAAYDWLDVAVGSDTGGSIRGPASNSGVFGNRPSHGLVSLDNVMPLAPELDTAGFLTRDARIWGALQAAMYGDSYHPSPSEGVAYPTEVLALDFPPTNTSKGRMIHKFASDLAKFLHANLTAYSLEEDWAVTGPADLRGVELTDYFNLTYSALIAKRQTALLRDPFYEDYAAKHDGRTPYIDPAPRVRWAWADSQSPSIIDEALQNKTRFMEWFSARVLPRASDASRCSRRFLLHTDSTGALTRRDTYLSPPQVPFGWSNGEISGFAEAPDSVFPLGELPYFSEVTNHTEFLPVSIDIMVAKFCDGLIPRLAQDLLQAGILPSSQAGRTLEGGEVLLKRRG